MSLDSPLAMLQSPFLATVLSANTTPPRLPHDCPLSAYATVILTPFASHKANAFNPCFLSLVYIGISAFFGLLCLFQFVQLAARKTHGSCFSLENVGVLQFLRVALILVQITFLFALGIHSNVLYTISDIRTAGYLSAAVSLLAFVLPLHVVEPVTSPAASGSLLVYWLTVAVFQVCVVVQNTTEWQVLPGTKILDILILVNAAVILILETSYWSPAKRLIGYYTTHSQSLAILNIFEYITFSWMTPLIVKSYNDGILDESKIPEFPPAVNVVNVADRVALSWKKEASRPSPSLLRALVKVFGRDMALVTIFQLAECCVLFIQPLLLRLLIRFFSAYQNEPETTPPLLFGAVLSVAMFANSMLELLAFNFCFLRVLELGFNCKTGLMTLLYTKALRMSSEARLKSSGDSEDASGDVVNLVSVDVANLQNMSQNAQLFVSLPFKSTLCVLSLYYLMGWAVFGGVAVLVLMVPVNVLVARKMEKLYGAQMKTKDLRTKAINELLTSIKSIKLYAWEKPVMEKVTHIRNDLELENIRRIGIFDAVSVFFWEALPFLITFATFATFLVLGTAPLTPDLIFPALALFAIMGDLIYEIPGLISAFIETRVSLARLSGFLASGEIDTDLIEKSDTQTLRAGDESIRVLNSTFLWSKSVARADEEATVDRPKVALHDISFSSRKARLTCIVGTVGSGKSAMLKAILGELPLLSGSKIKIDGTLVYCAQSPWIMNGTVQDNITFGCRFDPDFYAKTVEACALGPDMKVFPDGDKTQVGEKGISLSGGQKARIAIARAVYARADIYLLDDVLSAVDAHVAHYLTIHVLGPQGLLASKTKILTTNAIPILSHADEILLLVGGKIVERGSYEEAVLRAEGIYNLIKEHGIGSASEANSDTTSLVEGVGSAEGSPSALIDIERPDCLELPDQGTLIEIAKLDKPRRSSQSTLRRASVATFERKPRPKDDVDERKTAQALETSATGYVKWEVYKAYIHACGISSCIILTVFVVSSPILGLGSKLWLKHWSEDNEGNDGNVNAWSNIGVYFVLGLSSALGSYLHVLVMWCLCSLRASRVLHEGMLTAVVRSPMFFFETTPIGRVMNRFTSDVNQVDNGLPRASVMVFSILVQIMTGFVAITYVLPLFGFFIVFMLVFYIYYRNYYLVTSRELKRITSVTLSPIFAHILETLSGIDTIRAYGQTARFEFLHVSNIESNLQPAYANMSSSRWISFRLKVIGSAALFVVSSLCILSLTTASPMSSGMIGFIITSSVDVSMRLGFSIRMAVDAQARFVSVERIMEYTKLVPEAEPVVEGKRPQPQGPDQGEISFVNYTTRYRENLDPVLSNLSLDIKPREKIGIVGRTGAGKSTLTLALFRMIEPTGGHITIDGANTSEMGLRDLRSSLNIIPQDSQIFQGTVRRNLDPFDRHTDAELWKVLKLAHLDVHVASMGDTSGDEDAAAVGLLAKLNEGGSNLSVGQKQLMCLARALLNTSTVLVLDEATSSVDVQTDKIIQETIRSEFASKTILTIAHRLDTVMDCDRIVVLDKGEVKEFDSPATLLADKNGIFYGLCEQGGYL
ncbi:hypothetical protein BABINDRAFT_167477 [Babjeviella inositovora NRRL Y-12698]|uniref:P-loop containing nucleoside triphosphate hydrolase protein n=1 Tax=Babjeviella inositovora NRRL Y-12698 TaxID=984486 RepID=A0A1E3QPS2_9ASCO|nr:uncharacterized protein BABINDRAFT_167477 [Babjeviella inositovora NRRL Y-12698]ODQ79638.1 hypothetical protein BABINDRAFT_167477 [Babjeviella inositovora NRRL Y-12698]